MHAIESDIMADGYLSEESDFYGMCEPDASTCSSAYVTRRRRGDCEEVGEEKQSL